MKLCPQEVQKDYHLSMLRMFCCLTVLFASSCAFCQPGTQTDITCDNNVLHRGRIWSPDCRSYFDRVQVSWPRVQTPFVLEVYTVRGTTSLSDPTHEVTCNLAVEALTCSPIKFHHTEWVGSDRLRLHVRMLCGRGRTERNLTYVVDAQTGHIFDSSMPVTRNWSCQLPLTSLHHAH
jgi:hypothetical protein